MNHRRCDGGRPPSTTSGPGRPNEVRSARHPTRERTAACPSGPPTGHSRSTRYADRAGNARGRHSRKRLPPSSALLLSASAGVVTTVALVTSGSGAVADHAARRATAPARSAARAGSIERTISVTISAHYLAEQGWRPPLKAWMIFRFKHKPRYESTNPLHPDASRHPHPLV